MTEENEAPKDDRPPGHYVGNCRVIDTIWVTTIPGIDCLGFVLIDDGYEKKIYCGQGFGIDQTEDIEKIVRHGGKIHPGLFIPFMSKAWANRLTKFCGKCGNELDDKPPTVCKTCGTWAKGDVDDCTGADSHSEQSCT